MSLIKTWAPHFQSGIRMRGRAYQAAGRVKRLSPANGELVRAEVKGKRPYTVVIRGEGATASVECNCSFFAGGSYCKHIWATILDVQYNPLESVTEETTESADQPQLRAPKARKRADGQKTSQHAEPEWIGRLSLLRPPVVGSGLNAPVLGAAAPQGQVCYAVNPDLSSRYNALVVMLRQREPTQTGWSRLKKLRMAPGAIDDMRDPADRELCSIISSAITVESDDATVSFRDDGASDCYRLARGVALPVLQRMIQTGRCFVESDGEATPLTWDGDRPWVLWMLGTQVGDEMVVTTELRRERGSGGNGAGDERMPIDRPRLIVPGVDGLVVYGSQAAPFDDRGAARWVSQFRDDWRFGGRAAPIKVPGDDLPRFLDRLYRLPQLPEIELPPGVGRQELRIKPVPHLELFSPDGQDPLGAATPRSQLIARLWFAYDQNRVKPGQAGRYVGIVVPAKPQANVEAVEEETGENAEAVAEETQQGGMIRRDIQVEQDSVALLTSLGLRQHPGNGMDTLLLPVRQMPSVVGALLTRGWVVTADQRVLHNPGPPRLSIASGIDWFELHGGVKYQTANGEQSVSLPEILAALQAGKKMITLGDGSEGLLPEEWLEQHGLLTAMGKVQGDHLRFKNTQAALLDSLLNQQDLTEVDEKFEAARQRLREFEGIKPVEPATTFKGTLRPYQCEGLGWLAFLRWFGMGGVLADDMGLGKTIQVLGMLDARYGEGRDQGNKGPRDQGAEGTGSSPSVPGSLGPSVPSSDHRPSLIVVPRSVIFNWIDEAKHFAPNLRVQAYTGADRNALRDAFIDHDVIVTSYGLMRRDIAELRKHPFDYIVLDEAQAIKNPASQSAKAARLIEANHRLALTGTPVENHLGDLWSIFEFLNPGMLGSSTKFGLLVRGEDGSGAAATNGNGANGANGVSAAPTEPANAAADHPRQTLDARSTAQIAKALRPFILRRTKKQVLSELPEKTEQTIVCEMEPEQRKLYDQLRIHYRGTLLGKLDAAPSSTIASSGSTMMVLEALLRLRQAACHPGLIDPKRADEPSAKLDVLLDRLADLIEEGHKALVFSQFTSMLALVRRRLDERKIVYEYLDGQTRHRKKHVQRFQTDPDCPLFLISLKAGGLGLNLTAAEYVFILDPWWNPAVEAQAIDRIHRIGQTQHVFAYRLICQDTVEQRIAELQDKKRKLADAIVGGQESVLSSLSRDDLDQLLS